MKPVLLLMAAVLCAQADDLERTLDDIARVASVMVDGDVCQRIVTARAEEYIVKGHPRDKWFGSDNYDVNHGPYIQTKKTLMRLARLNPAYYDVNLWMPIGDSPRKIHVVIRNDREISQFWTFGTLVQDMIPEMREVLETGKRVTVQQKPGILSVLAPVRNSLGDVVGLVEVVGREKPDAHENVK